MDSTASVNAAFQLSGATSYTYNASRNMLTRSNTVNTGNNLSAITYNHVNLPSTLTAGTAAIVYTYDAAGKIQEVDYYAFGLDIQRSLIGTENKYQYNGKEKQNRTTSYFKTQLQRNLQSSTQLLIFSLEQVLPQFWW